MILTESSAAKMEDKCSRGTSATMNDRGRGQWGCGDRVERPLRRNSSAAAIYIASVISNYLAILINLCLNVF